MNLTAFNSIIKQTTLILLTIGMIIFISCSGESDNEPIIDGMDPMDNPTPSPDPENPPVVTAGEWVKIADTKLLDLNPCPSNDCDYSANEGFEGIINDWCGGVFDPIGNRMIIWGGGHEGYYGNDVYAFDLDTSTWSQIMAPSDYDALASYEPLGQYPDGRPIARHTYGNIAFVTSQNTFLATGAYGISPTGNGDNRFWALNLDSTSPEWEEKTASESIGSLWASYAAYNPIDKMVYYHKASNGRFYKYDSETDTHTYLTSRTLQIYPAAAIDSKRNKLLVLGGYSSEQAFVWDLNGSEPTSEDLTDNANFQSSFGSKLANDGKFGLDYDIVNDKFVAWKGGKTLYIIDPETYEVTKKEPSGGDNPGDAVLNGTYGRFRYAPSLKGFVLVNNADQDVYTFKL